MDRGIEKRMTEKFPGIATAINLLDSAHDALSG
jgi:hypothetical protein